MTILVTGAAGFIGTNFVLDWFKDNKEPIVSLDLLTYAGNKKNFDSLNSRVSHYFICGDISDRLLVGSLLKKFKPRAIINFAAETHVDRSIQQPENFIEANIIGSFELLESVRYYFELLNEEDKKNFRFLHISTDEVYGSLEANEPAFNEFSSYQPNNPYSASKAASDHLMRAWFKTFNIPIIKINSSNNFGPYQNFEKLIPKTILNALLKNPITLYGDGLHIRDWIYVKDFTCAIRNILNKGKPGQNYNVGGQNEKTNLEIVKLICGTLDIIKPAKDLNSYKSLVKKVKDRTGHDFRYAMDITKIKQEINWGPKTLLNEGILETVNWYLANFN